MTAPSFSLDDEPDGPSQMQAIVNWVQSLLADLPTAVDSGSATVTSVPGTSITSIPVTFKPGLFTKVPVVVCNPDSTLPNLPFATAQGVSLSGFNMYFYRVVGTTGTTLVHWIAVQS